MKGTNKSPIHSARARGLPVRRTARGGVLVDLPGRRLIHFQDDDVISDALDAFPRLHTRTPPKEKP